MDSPTALAELDQLSSSIQAPLAARSENFGAALQRLMDGLGWGSASLRASQRRVDELTKANGRKDELLAMVCHEMRSPLASIHYAVRLLGNAKQQAADKVQTQALLERQLQHVGQLVDDLLDMSRIANGHMQLQRQRVDLRLIVGNAIQTLAPQIEARGQQLTTVLPGKPVWLKADPLRLEQVFLNLLANAAKYTPPGGRLAVWLHARGSRAIVRVRDSGIGMEPQLLPHIFDLFRQADGADAGSSAGLGIGLAIVRSLVEQHGGRVSASSRGAGQGSMFTVRLYGSTSNASTTT